MRRLTILLAIVGALLLIPAAQAFANGNMNVNIAGTGNGEVTSKDGIHAWGGVYEEFFPPGYYEGIPPIECTYVSPGPEKGLCEDELSNEGEGFDGIAMRAIAAPGSKFVEWIVEEGNGTILEEEGCEGKTGHCLVQRAPKEIREEAPPNTEATAIFECTPEGEAEKLCGGPSGPTNLRTLTVTKSPAPNAGTGVGSVSSKPKGIKCGTTCSEAVAAMYKDTPVTLTAKPSTGSTFKEWQGSPCDESTSPTCTVPMAEDESVLAVFEGVSKPFSPAEALTLEKAGDGKGTVKAAGLGCEAECTSTTVLYQGPITEPKEKPGKTVVLKQAPAFGSTFSGWSGCDTETEAGECVVEMDEAHSVSAEYTALPNKTLTVNKAYSSGNGSVSSKPKGIACAATCTQSVASMPEGAAVELLAKPGTETTFVEWVGGDCGGSTNPVCVVTMNTDETTKAVFSKAGKAFLGGSEPTLTLNKAGSGYGTVKASGIKCEVLCTSQSALYQGPITEPKAKPGKAVVLKAASAPGSKAVEWSGCDTVTEAGECVVAMEEAKEVTATFDELE